MFRKGGTWTGTGFGCDFMAQMTEASPQLPIWEGCDREMIRGRKSPSASWDLAQVGQVRVPEQRVPEQSYTGPIN